MSKRSQIIGIRQNRQAELRHQRTIRGQQARATMTGQEHGSVQDKSSVANGYTHIDRIESTDLLDKLLKQNFPRPEQEE